MLSDGLGADVCGEGEQAEISIAAVESVVLEAGCDAVRDAQELAAQSYEAVKAGCDAVRDARTWHPSAPSGVSWVPIRSLGTTAG